MSWINAVTPVMTAIVAAGAALGGPWLTERRQNRTKQRVDKAAFQRQTLLDLQDVLMQLYGLTVHHFYDRPFDQEPSEAERREISEKLILLNGKARV